MKKLVLLAMLASAALAGCGDTGGGERIGQVVKVGQYGFFCKTWEVEVIKGGMSAGSGSFGAPFEFTIENRPDLVAQVQGAMESGKEIRVEYKTEFATLCRTDGHHNRFATKITVVDDGRVLNVVPEKAKVDATAPTGKTVEDLLAVQAELIKKLASERK